MNADPAKKEIVIRTGTNWGYWGVPHSEIDAYSVRGNRVWRAEVRAFCYYPVFEDFDGDGFMEIAMEGETGIAILDLTPQ